MLRWFLLGLFVALAATGCSSIRGERVETGMASSDDPQSVLVSEPTDRSQAVSVAAAVNAFSFTSTELFFGAPVRGQDVVRNAPLMMTFVSPTCDFSADDALAYAAAADTYSDITFVFVHSGGDTAAFQQWVEEADLFHENVLHLEDSDGLLNRRFAVTSLPTSLLVDASGNGHQTVGALGHEGLSNAAALLGN